MLRTPILQAPGAITPEHVQARTIQHPSNGIASSRPCQGHHHAPMSGWHRHLRTSSSAVPTTYLHRGLHPPHTWAATTAPRCQ